MTRIRQPAVAGTFYPADPRTLAADIDHLLAGIRPVDEPAPPRAIVVPHAGYRYSGHTAATAYARLAKWAGAIERVVIAGPAHRVWLEGAGLPSDDTFATPLGDVPVDRTACGRLLAHPMVSVNDATHRHEHSVEVQLPFLQRVLGDGWSLVPVVVGEIRAPDFADAFETLWGAPGTLFVISTDLSHYQPLAAARRLDLATAATIVSGDWEQLRADDACGLMPLRGAMELARRHDQYASVIELTTSADGGSPTDAVVGYGSFVLR